MEPVTVVDILNHTVRSLPWPFGKKMTTQYVLYSNSDRWCELKTGEPVNDVMNEKLARAARSVRRRHG